jgi:hypothetical protein
MAVSFDWQRSVRTVIKSDLPDRKLLMAKQNVSQRRNAPSISAAHQTVNPRATSTAEAVDSYLKAVLVRYFDASSLLPPLALHVEPWRLKRGLRLRRPRRTERWTSISLVCRSAGRCGLASAT